MAIEFVFMLDRDNVKWYELFVILPSGRKASGIKIYGAQSLSEAITTLLYYQPEYKECCLEAYCRVTHTAKCFVIAGTLPILRINSAIEFRLIVDKFMAVQGAAKLS